MSEKGNKTTKTTHEHAFNLSWERAYCTMRNTLNIHFPGQFYLDKIFANKRGYRNNLFLHKCICLRCNTSQTPSNRIRHPPEEGTGKR